MTAGAAQAGTYTVTVTSPEARSYHQQQLPLAVTSPFTATAAASPDPVCFGDTLHLAPAVSSPLYHVIPIPYNAASSAAGTVLCSGGVNNQTANYTHSGTAVTLDDGCWSNIPLPFNFSFYGVSYSSIKIIMNGSILFGNAGFSWLPQTIPTALSEQDNFIAANWMDLNPGLTPYGTIKYNSLDYS